MLPLVKNLIGKENELLSHKHKSTAYIEIIVVAVLNLVYNLIVLGFYPLGPRVCSKYNIVTC